MNLNQDNGREGPGLFGRPWFRAGLILVLVAGISVLHYLTNDYQATRHLAYRLLYFLPLILAGFWFGLKGGLVTSLAVTAIYLPFVMLSREVWSPGFFSDLMEIGLFNVVAVLVGFLRQRERRHQEQLSRAESLAAMGEAVSAVAHDMKTPLMAIGGFATQVRQGLPLDERHCKKLDIIIDQTARLEAMVKEMLDFSQPLKLRPVRERLLGVVDKTVELAADLAAQRGVTLRGLSMNSLGPLSLDPGRMQQALLNLVVNAVQASPPGGEVKVSLSRQGKEAWVEVADQGEGVPEASRQEILNPFVTTKKDGTGLGLPVVQKIVQAHGGRLEITANQPRGAVFRVVLPLDGRDAAPARDRGPIEETGKQPFPR